LAENKFSLEDILSEYPSDGESPDEAALDDILSSYRHKELRGFGSCGDI